MDNSRGTVAVTLIAAGTLHTLYIEPGWYGFYPVLFGSPAQLTVSSAGNTGAVQVLVLNRQRHGTWNAISSGGGTAETVENMLLSGVGPPPLTLGAAGDYYIDSAAEALYGAKSWAAGWGNPIALVGPIGGAGPVGAAGATGAAGIQGPIGVTGAAGAVGPIGPIGLTGATGAAGTSPSGAANLVVATPSGSSGVAGLRALVAGDIPVLPYDAAGAAAAAVAAIPFATASLSGLLSSGDWTTFNGKQSAIAANTYDAYGAATAAQAAAIAASDTVGAAATVQAIAVLKANNLSDVTAATARTNLAVPGLAAPNNFTGPTVTFTGNVAIAGITARQQLSVGASLDFYSGAVNTPTVPSIRAGGVGLVLNGFGAAPVLLNYDSGTSGVAFYNGATTPALVASVSAAGLGTFVGLASSAAITGTLGGWSTWILGNPTPSGSMTASISGPQNTYYRIGAIVFFRIYGSVTIGGTPSNTLTFTLPVANATAMFIPCAAFIGGNLAFAQIVPSSATLQLLPNGIVAYPSGPVLISISGFYSV